MSILFSPIGTADPATHLGDGPMLHIVRHKQPSVVVLYLSPEMAKHEQADGRYSRAIAHLAKVQGQVVPHVEAITSEFDEVYRFDHYINEFEELLNSLSVKYPGDEIMANASSGTPAMEQALVALGAFGRPKLQLLQVLTPRQGINKKDDREDPESYDFDFMMDWSNEIEEGRAYESRIVEVESPNFYNRMLRENVITLVKDYEYAAAYELAKQSPLINESVKDMILASAERLDLNAQNASGVFGGTPLAYKANDLVSEYLYGMEVRFEQKRWADFLRAMTPPFTEEMKRILTRSGLDETRYMLQEKGAYTGKYDPKKIAADRRLQLAFGPKHDRAGFMQNHMYERLVEEYCLEREVVERVHKLRRMEEVARNKLAHEVRSARKDALEKEGRMSMEEVLDSLIYLHDWIMPSQPMSPGLYRRISDEIISKL